MTKARLIELLSEVPDDAEILVWNEAPECTDACHQCDSRKCYCIWYRYTGETFSHKITGDN